MALTPDSTPAYGSVSSQEAEYTEYLQRQKEQEKIKQKRLKEQQDRMLTEQLARRQSISNMENETSLGQNQREDIDLTTQVMLLLIGTDSTRFVLQVADGESRQSANQRISVAYNQLHTGRASGDPGASNGISQHSLDHSLLQARQAQQAAERARLSAQQRSR
ncbi:MAG: hypothetical protein MK137_06405 [Rickettsiales bacterium]|nr:hypothetical protein [Rickettsiales bacterium]